MLAARSLSADRTASLHSRAKNGEALTASEVDWIFGRLANAESRAQNAEARAHKAEAALQAQQPPVDTCPGSAHSDGYMPTVKRCLQSSRSQSVKAMRSSSAALMRLGLPGAGRDSHALQRSVSSADAFLAFTRGQSAPALRPPEQRRSGGLYPSAVPKLPDPDSPVSVLAKMTSPTAAKMDDFALFPAAKTPRALAKSFSVIGDKPSARFPRMPFQPLPVGENNHGNARPSTASTASSQGRPLKCEHLTGAGAGLWSTGLINEAHRVYTLADRNRNGVLDFHELEHVKSCLGRVHPELWPAPLTPAFAGKIMGIAIDTDESGDVDRVEWIRFITQQAKAHGERPMLKLMQVLGKQLDKDWVPGGM